MKQYRFIIFISILYIILLSYLPSTNEPTTTAKTKSGRGGRQYYAVHKVRRYAPLKVMGFELGGWVLAATKTPTALQSILWPIIDPILVTFGDKVTKFNRDSSYYF